MGVKCFGGISTRTAEFLKRVLIFACRKAQDIHAKTTLEDAELRLN